MNSNSSPNSTENSSIISESLKEMALSLIKDENINEKEITAYSQDLMTIPNLDEDVVNIDSPLLETNSFGIFSTTNINPVFARNLLNIIHIINFIWLASKNKVEIFHRTLLNLGIMLSFSLRKMGCRCILLHRPGHSAERCSASTGRQPAHSADSLRRQGSFRCLMKYPGMPHSFR